MSVPEPARELTISADSARLGEAREWAAALAAQFGLDEDDCFAVRLAVSEAVTNAILHGSASPDDLVTLAARAEGDRLVFEVKDTARQPQTRFERPLGGGRGLGMVALVTDEMHLACDDAGSVLRFAKRR